MTTTVALRGTRHWDPGTPALDPATGIITDDSGQEILRPWDSAGARSTVIYGAVATGKTELARWLAAEYMRSGVAVTWVADPFSRALPEMTGNAAMTAGSVDDALLMLWSAYAVMQARRAQLGPPDAGRLAVLPGRAPQLRVIIDEAERLLRHPVRGAEATCLVAELATLGRRARVGLDITVTDPTLRAMAPPSLRDALQPANVNQVQMMRCGAVIGDSRPGYPAVRDGQLLKVTGRAPLVAEPARDIPAAARHQATLDPVSLYAANGTFKQLAGEAG